MPIVTDPFDVNTEAEVDALARTFYQELDKVIEIALMQARIEESRTPSKKDIIAFVEKEILGISEHLSENRFDVVLYTMGAEANVHPLVHDRVLFLREFAMRFIVPNKERAQALREQLRKITARM